MLASVIHLLLHGNEWNLWKRQLWLVMVTFCHGDNSLISSKPCNCSLSDCVGSNQDVAHENLPSVTDPSFPMVWIWLARLDCATKLIHSRFIHFGSFVCVVSLSIYAFILTYSVSMLLWLASFTVPVIMKGISKTCSLVQTECSVAIELSSFGGGEGI